MIAHGRSGRLQREAVVGDGLEEELVNGVVFDARAELANHSKHLSAENFVPAEIAFDVDALRTLFDCVPDGFAGLDAGGFHLITFGDDAGTLIAENANGFAEEEGIAHTLGGD